MSEKSEENNCGQMFSSNLLDAEGASGGAGSEQTGISRNHLALCAAGITVM